MATKKFLIEVEEGHTHCDDKCPLKHSGVCLDFECELENIFDFVDCCKYNLATMKIKEYYEPNCYNLQCLSRNPNEPKEEEK